MKVPYVDRERIGVIEICGSGGFALSAASVDTRIKAVAATAMYDITGGRIMFGLPAEVIEQQKNELSRQCWTDFENGCQSYTPSFPETPYPDVDSLPEKDPISNEWDRFYAMPRGHHPNARGGFTDTSDACSKSCQGAGCQHCNSENRPDRKL